MSTKKTFKYGERVRVKVPRKRAFFGTVYSEYRDGPRGERRICVWIPNGCGVAFLVRYIQKAPAKNRLRS